MKTLRLVSFLVLAGCGGGTNNGGDGGGNADLAGQPLGDFAFNPGDGGGGGPGPSIAGCPIFPVPPNNMATGLNDEWNRDVSGDQVDPMSDAYIMAMNGLTKNLHPDFGSDPTYGIPWITVPGSQAKVPVAFDYPDESDPGPYPFPDNAPIEGGSGASGDRHVLVIDRDSCTLYETFDSHFVGPGWMCGSGAKWDLRSTKLRPDTWTSADAAGLPILPGLVRRDEAASGEIKHAFRMTVNRTQKAYIHPATHYASSATDATLPPMGLRVRMKAGYDISRFTGQAKVIATAMKKYGMIVADNGSDWYFTGEMNAMWDDNDIGQLKSIPGAQFEVVKTGTIMK